MSAEDCRHSAVNSRRAVSQPDDNLSDDSSSDELIRDDPELAEFSDLIANLRSGGPIEPEAPADHVWAQIEASIVGTEPTLGTAPIARLDDARNDRLEAAERQTAWGRRAAMFTAVAAALLLVAVPIGLALRGDDDPPVELAAAELGVLTSAASEPGTAALIDRDDNGLWLKVSADADAAGTDFLELWMLRIGEDGEPAEVISLGKLDGSDGYDVPDDIDLNETWLVDISVEIDDGDDQHGGNSVLQGQLS